MSFLTGINSQTLAHSSVFGKKVTDLPPKCLSSILSFCDPAEVKSLSRTNRAFKALDSSDPVLSLSGCTCLSSIDQLCLQVKQLIFLKVPHPEGKEWTMAEVLKRYSLKTIDFSNRVISRKECYELVSLLADMSSPLEVSELRFGSLDLNSPQHFLLALSELCKNVRTLSFDDRNSQSQDTINDYVISTALDAFPMVENFSLKNAPKVTDRSLTDIPSKWPHLKTVHSEGCGNISTKTIIFLLKNCSALTTMTSPHWNSIKEEVKDYLQLRILNRMLKENNFRKFLNEFNKLTLVRNSIIKHLIWVHTGRFDVLENDPEKIKLCSKPYISIRGEHLLEQFEERLLDNIECQLTNTKEAGEKFSFRSLFTFQTLLEYPDTTESELQQIFVMLAHGIQTKALESLRITFGALPKRTFTDLVKRVVLPRIDRPARLPTAVAVYIFSFTDYQTLRSLSLVSKAFKSAVITTRRQKSHLGMAELTDALRRLLGLMVPEESLGKKDWLKGDLIRILSNIEQRLSPQEKTKLTGFIEQQFNGITSLDFAVLYTDKELLQVLKLLGKTARQLLSINLCGSLITAENFAEIGSLCPSVTNLICHDTQMTDRGLTQIAVGFPHITAIALDNCMGITDEGVSQLAKGCTKLQNINLTNTSIKDKGIIAVADNCPELTGLNLFGCTVEDTTIIFYIAKKCPSLMCLQLPQNTSFENVIDFIQLYPNIGDCYSEDRLAALARMKSTLSYEPVTPFGKLLHAVYQKKPRSEIEKILNEQDQALSIKDVFWNLIHELKKEKVKSIYDVAYSELLVVMFSLIAYITEIDAKEMTVERMQQFIDHFNELTKMKVTFKPNNSPNYSAALVEIARINHIAMADALSIFSKK